ncbi:MAG TPA: esterase-like activity of phytase family protein [Kofleriaceae bacterium]|nr:esterase-like activity of phytase family protein [Kofleriaceae bacterium]
MPSRRAASLVLAAACACGGPAPEAEQPGTIPATITDVRRYQLASKAARGLSDLAVDPHGRTWAVAERIRVALRIDRPGAVPREVPLVGIPEDLDIEGMAWIDRERVALATESDRGARASDALFVARLGDRGIEVVERRDLDYSIWPLDAIGNQGMEGLCRAGPLLVVSIETVIAHRDARFAPIAVHDLATGEWTPFLLRLTTRTGKISALACAPPRADRSIDVLAIERHFEVARLIRFRVQPTRRAPRTIAPVVVADLDVAMVHQENFEGLWWDGGRAISLVVDNDWTHVSGPNLLVTARLHGAIPAPPAR